MNYEGGRGGGEKSTSAISFSSALREIGAVCASTVNPIKIKLITKGKTHAHAQIKAEKISSAGAERDRRTESKCTDGKKDERDLRELRVGTVAARLHCSFVPPRLSGKGCRC